MTRSATAPAGPDRRHRAARWARPARPAPRLLVVLPVVLLVGGSTAALATSDGAAADHASQGAHTALTLHLRTTAFATLDLGPAGPSAGDASFRKDDVTNPAGLHVGVMNSTCVANVPSDPFGELDELCNGVIDLDGRGQIHWQSSNVDVPPPPPPPPPAIEHTQLAPTRRFGPWAVLGGTGNYLAARGQIIDDGPGSADRVVRVQLVPR